MPLCATSVACYFLLAAIIALGQEVEDSPGSIIALGQEVGDSPGSIIALGQEVGD